LKVKSKVLVYAGKHAGKQGKVDAIDEKNKMVIVNYGENKLNILIKQIMVLE
jgi:ribosomal protein L24